MAMRKKNVGHLITLGCMLFLMSCANEPKKTDVKPATVEEHIVLPVEVQHADSTKSDTLSPKKEVENVSTSQPISNTYDDGYLDGEAMAEEDRLAGKPGMQVGMDDDDDDDDDDYEDGFDDGYDE